MDLFEIKNDQVTFSPQALALKPLRALWDRDKKKGKPVATAELAALYFYADYKSDFSEILDPNEKIDVIKSYVIGMPKNWKPDEVFQAAVDFYKDRMQTISTILLEDSKTAISKISTFLRNVDLTEMDDNGKFVHDIKKINDVIGALPKTVETVNKMEDMVKKELQAKDSMRGRLEGIR
jgi:hypothetical protein